MTGGIAFVATRGETDFPRLARVGGDVSGASRRDGTDARARARVDSRADRRWETRRVTRCLARDARARSGRSGRKTLKRDFDGFFRADARSVDARRRGTLILSIDRSIDRSSRSLLINIY